MLMVKHERIPLVTSVTNYPLLVILTSVNTVSISFHERKLIAYTYH